MNQQERAIMGFFENNKSIKDVAKAFNINENQISDILIYAKDEWKNCNDKKIRKNIVANTYKEIVSYLS